MLGLAFPFLCIPVTALPSLCQSLRVRSDAWQYCLSMPILSNTQHRFTGASPSTALPVHLAARLRPAMPWLSRAFPMPGGSLLCLAVAFWSMHSRRLSTRFGAVRCHSWVSHCCAFAHQRRPLPRPFIAKRSQCTAVQCRTLPHQTLAPLCPCTEVLRCSFAVPRAALP